MCLLPIFLFYFIAEAFPTEHDEHDDRAVSSCPRAVGSLASPQTGAAHMGEGSASKMDDSLRQRLEDHSTCAYILHCIAVLQKSPWCDPSKITSLTCDCSFLLSPDIDGLINIVPPKFYFPPDPEEMARKFQKYTGKVQKAPKHERKLARLSVSVQHSIQTNQIQARSWLRATTKIARTSPRTTVMMRTITRRRRERAQEAASSSSSSSSKKEGKSSSSRREPAKQRAPQRRSRSRRLRPKRRRASGRNA